jgi:hypothetical protein
MLAGGPGQVSYRVRPTGIFGAKAMAIVRPRLQLQRLCLLGAIGGLSLLLLAGALLLWAHGDQPKVLGQAEWQNVPPDTGAAGRQPRVLTFRSQLELLRALGLPGDGKSRQQVERFFIKAFNTKAVDFKTRTLLLVVAGTQPSRGYRVEVTRVEHDRETKVLRVHWKLHPPPTGQPVAQLPAHPAALVLLRRFDEDVKLVLAEEAGQVPGKHKKD